jgi:hypothetical protein
VTSPFPVGGPGPAASEPTSSQPPSGPALHPGYQPAHPFYWPPAAAPPPKPRTGALAKVFITLLSIAIVAVLGAGVVLVPTAGKAPVGLTFIDPDATGRAIRNLVSQREKAVVNKDKTGFMSGVDTRDTRFLKREETEYDNLVKLPLDSFKLTIGNNSLDGLIKPDSELLKAFPHGVTARAVTIHYAVHGIDTEPIAVPWTPVFGQVNGVWKIGGELTTYKTAEARLATSPVAPQGAGGQPWQGGPITVVRDENVLLVLSQSDADLGTRLEQTASDSVKTVASKVPSGWSKQIMVTAVNDKAVFLSYFAFSTDQAEQVAALAVPFYNEVPDWTPSSELHYASSRVVFNPDELTESPRALQQVLTHEFTHVALGSKTSGGTPLWLVEGTAEYVGYTDFDNDINWTEVASDFRQSKLTQLPDDRTFYDVGFPSYVASWLMCRLIARNYGEEKLFALYEHFQTEDRGGTRDDWDAAIHSVLGTSLSSLESKWRTFAKNPS